MKTEQIIIRVSEQDKRHWSMAAAERDLTLSEYIRSVVSAAAAGEDESALRRANYPTKEKIVREGGSAVFNSWSERAGVTEEDFLAGLRWLCGDPQTGGLLRRELGCICDPETLPCKNETDRELWGRSSTHTGRTGLVRLTRVYDADGLCSLYDEAGELWISAPNRASISLRDRI